MSWFFAYAPEREQGQAGGFHIGQPDGFSVFVVGLPAVITRLHREQPGDDVLSMRSQDFKRLGVDQIEGQFVGRIDAAVPCRGVLRAVKETSFDLSQCDALSGLRWPLKLRNLNCDESKARTPP
jgi:hypothetical protein